MAYMVITPRRWDPCVRFMLITAHMLETTAIQHRTAELVAVRGRHLLPQHRHQQR